MGTWGVIGMETPQPIINEEVFGSGYGNEGSADGRSFLAKNVTGLWIIQQCRDRWVRESVRDISWDEIVSASSSAVPMQAFIDVDDPIFTQPETDMPKVVAEHCRDKGERIPENMGEVGRCIYESLVMKLRYNLE